MEDTQFCSRCQKDVSRFEDHDPRISHLGNEPYASWQLVRSVNTGTETKVTLERNELPMLCEVQAEDGDEL